jgi:succinate dehydrogenase / fumarate reductase membrane anchor subunit
VSAYRHTSETHLSRVRGLGGAKTGVGHWWRQRVTAVGNVGLVLWFVISLVLLPDLQFATVTAWLRQPLVAIPMLLLIANVFTHFRLGVQVMIEDYVHSEGNKLISLMALNFYTVAVGAIAAFSVLRIAFGA